jgi:hypothetical protein
MSAPKPGSNRPFLPDFNIEGLTTYWRRLYPRKTADKVAADTGLPIETVKNWLKGRNGLRVPQLLVILAVYGPDALAACWGGRPPAWLNASVAAKRSQDLDRLQAQIDAERAALMALPTPIQEAEG